MIPWQSITYHSQLTDSWQSLVDHFLRYLENSRKHTLWCLTSDAPRDGIHMHIMLFCNVIKAGRLAAILVVIKTQYLTRPQPFLRHAFTDLVQTWQKDNEWWLPYACHYFKIKSNMADWWSFCYLDVSPTISRTCMVRFCSNAAQAQYTMAYTCT